MSLPCIFLFLPHPLYLLPKLSVLLFKVLCPSLRRFEAELEIVDLFNQLLYLLPLSIHLLVKGLPLVLKLELHPQNSLSLLLHELGYLLAIARILCHLQRILLALLLMGNL